MYYQQQHLGMRTTSGDTITVSLLGPVPAQEQVLEEAFLSLLSLPLPALTDW